MNKPLKDDETFNIRTSTMVVGIRGTSGTAYKMVLTNPTGYTSLIKLPLEVTDTNGTVVRVDRLDEIDWRNSATGCYAQDTLNKDAILVVDSGGQDPHFHIDHKDDAGDWQTISGLTTGNLESHGFSVIYP